MLQTIAMMMTRSVTKGREVGGRRITPADTNGKTRLEIYMFVMMIMGPVQGGIYARE